MLEDDLDCGVCLAPHGRLDQLARHRHRLARAALLGERPGQQRPGQQRADVPGAEVGRQHPGLPAEQRLGPRQSDVAAARSSMYPVSLRCSG